MEHTNYCRSMTKQLDLVLASPNIQRDRATAEKLNLIKTLAHLSTKFMLPVNGRFFEDDELKALDSDIEARLPHQVIALEFPIAKGAYLTDAGQPTKSVVFAWEADSDIQVRRCEFYEHAGSWCVNDQLAVPKVGAVLGLENGRRLIQARPVADPGFDARGPEEDWHAPTVLLSFLNALACSNVRVARSEPKKAGKKIKAALPFDTYHVLTIDVLGKAGDGAATGGHRSPREHLRRGHIRRLADGRRIWVNATVVAAGRSAGVVKKDYAVRCAA